MQNWVILDENYLNYLRSFEGRIPLSDYGTDRMKPFFGKLFEVDDLVYVTQVSHIKPRHLKMHNSPDFQKIYIKSSNSSLPDRLVAVVNLNYMFPVPKELVQPLFYCNINQHRTFVSEAEKSKYVDLLKKEMASINSMGIEAKALKLYNRKLMYPEDTISKRCIDFKDLEEQAHSYTAK